MIQIEDIRQRESYDCGATACECVCKYYGLEKRKSEMLKLTGSTDINGACPRSLESFFRTNGFKVVSGEMDINDLKYMANKQARPIIVLVKMEGEGHYIVIRGISRGRVYYQCPINGPKSQKIEDFKKIWLDTDRFGANYYNWGLVAWK